MEILNRLKKAVFYYVISLVAALVLLLGFFIIGGFPPVSVFIISHAIVYFYTLYRDWHIGAWKVIVEKKTLTMEEKKEMFDI